MDYDIQLLTNVIEYNRQKYKSFKNGEYFSINDEYEKILNARYHKCGRVKRRLIYLFIHFKYIYFVTFTFNNHYIDKSTKTKRNLIKSVLNSYDFSYILNIDYGSKNEREHYHCILATNEDIDVNEYIQLNYKGGFSLSILCKCGLDDFKRLYKYVNKLVNHCLKATTKKQRIVYNFKGYDILYPSYRDRTIAFNLDFDKLFNNLQLD